MKRYVALLRGINISGKNKVPMAQLKEGFEGLAFRDVKTYLNSGNVIFSADEANTEKLRTQIEGMIQNHFGFDVPVFVMEREALLYILRNAPDWWGNGGQEIYDNLIFMMPPLTFQAMYGEIGEPAEGLERIENYKEAVFWSFSRADYRKTNWWSKTASAAIGKKLTIRTANTVKRVARL